MCGIAGHISNSETLNEGTIKHILKALDHRGPNSNGVWISSPGITLMHTRLSILDLSSAGHQPMESKSDRFVITYNGEIYNHLELRKELSSYRDISIEWNGESDTETILVAFDVWGIEKSLKKFIGMFALAVWDKKNKSLTIARDRAGEKPLYYGRGNNSLFFASELSAFKRLPGFKNKINRDALSLYMKYSAVPSPYSIYEGIYKLEPGSHCTFQHDGLIRPPKKYWDIADVQSCKKDTESTKNINENKILEGLESVLIDAVSSQMISDVPIGAFLSGGVDSSLVAALMQSISDSKVKTFSIGFNDQNYNEAEYAREVARHIGSEHHDMYVSNSEILDVVPKLHSIYSEPFADSSQIPTYLVSKIAKNNVTVCLSGDAGDELFGGYTRYMLALKFHKFLKKIPKPARLALSQFIKNAPLSLLSVAGEKNLDKILKGADMLGAKSDTDFYSKGFMSHNNSLDWVKGSNTLETAADNFNYKNIGFHEKMMIHDFLLYLPNDILTKVDRAAMFTSLETRVPMLDRRVIEYAFSMPIDYKLRNGDTKWALKQILYKHVPQSLIDRPKKGFGVPLDAWLRGPLREWAESLLCKDRMKDQGYFNTEIVLDSWKKHLEGEHNYQSNIWDILMFQLWIENNEI